MNKVFLLQITVIFGLATACNSLSVAGEFMIASPTHPIAFTDTPIIEKTPTAAPTATITPAVIVSPEVHNLALNEENIEKVINLATFGETSKTCFNSSQLDSTLVTRFINGQTKYLLASENHKSSILEVWDLESKEQIQSFLGIGIDSAQFHPDQNSLIFFSRSEPANLTLWDIENRIEKHKFVVKGYVAERISISPDGLKVALFYGRGDGLGFRVSELNLQTNQLNDTFYDFPLYYETPPPYIYSPKGSLIAVTYNEDEKLHFIDLTSEKDIILEFPFLNREEVLNAEAIISTIAISQDETYLVGGGLNGDIYIWNIIDGLLVKSLEAHEPDRVDGWVGGIKILGFSPQSNLLLSVGYDDFTKLWDARTGIVLKEINTCHHFGGFTPDGRYLVTVGKSGIELWGIP